MSHKNCAQLTEVQKVARPKNYGKRIRLFKSAQIPPLKSHTKRQDKTRTEQFEVNAAQRRAKICDSFTYMEKSHPTLTVTHLAPLRYKYDIVTFKIYCRVWDFSQRTTNSVSTANSRPGVAVWTSNFRATSLASYLCAHFQGLQVPHSLETQQLETGHFGCWWSLFLHFCFRFHWFHMARGEFSLWKPLEAATDWQPEPERCSEIAVKLQLQVQAVSVCDELVETMKDTVLIELQKRTNTIMQQTVLST